MRFLLATLLLLSASIGWAQTEAPRYRWHIYADGGVYLYAKTQAGEHQVGAYDIKKDQYFPLLDWDAAVWGDAGEPPCSLPAQYAARHKTAKNAVQNFGVYRGKPTDARNADRYSLT